MLKLYSMHAGSLMTTNMLRVPAQARLITLLSQAKSCSQLLLSIKQPNAATGAKTRAYPYTQMQLELLSHYSLNASGKKKPSPPASASREWLVMPKEISTRSLLPTRTQRRYQTAVPLQSQPTMMRCGQSVMGVITESKKL